MSAADNHGGRRGAGRFRKPEFRAPQGGDGAEAPDDANLPAVNPVRMAEELGMALAPLKDLAEAFRQNSETLKSMAEGQARLGRRIEKSDRSEAVVQSTKALNETFRGVQRTQERLMGRLDEEKKRPVRLLVAAAVVFVALVGGSLYLLFTWLDGRDRLNGQERQETIAGIVDVHADVVDDLQSKLLRAETELARREALAGSAAESILDLTARISDLEEINRGLHENQAQLRREVMQNAGLQSTISRLSGELEETGRTLQQERQAAAGLEEQVKLLQEKLAQMARRAAIAPSAAPPASAPDASEETPPESAPPVVPAGAATDPGELDRIAGILNRLIAESRGEESYEFTKIGGARGRMLYNVEVANYDRNGAEVKRIEAGEAHIVVDVPQRRVDIRFKNGYIYYYGVRAPFWGGGYLVSVVNVNPATWLGSGLTIFDQLR